LQFKIMLSKQYMIHNFDMSVFDLDLDLAWPYPFIIPPFVPLYLTLPTFFPFFLLLRALGVLRMLPVLQRLSDAYGF